MKYKHMHFVGIKGSGMTALAIAAKEAGVKVTGSDVKEDFITKPALDKVSIKPEIRFDPSHIVHADLVITTGAHGGFDNPEVVAAREKNIPVMTHGQALGAFMTGELFGKKFSGIAIAGTHGKTTTTALIATLFSELGLDPSYVIGTGSIPSLPSPGHFGQGRYFVVEADEYATEPKYDTKARFLWLHPQIGVITNIEHDHPDIYRGIADVRRAFLAFANQITGVLIVCGDDPEVNRLLKDFNGRKITYGFAPTNDYVVKHMNISKEHTFFRLEGQGMDLGEFSTRIIGEHNVLNAVAAIVVGLEVGLTVENIRRVLPKFTGSKRRFEHIGTLESGAELYDDYAHHPTEIKKTLRAARLRFPGKKIVVIFQPHTYSRTKELFSDFSHAFSDADTILITDIFASAREEPDSTVSSARLVLKMKETKGNIMHLPSLSNVVEYLNQNALDERHVLLTMGAGDVYTIKDKLSLKRHDG